MIILSICCLWSGSIERSSRADSMDTQPYDSLLGETEAITEFAEGAQAHQEVRCLHCLAAFFNFSPCAAGAPHMIYIAAGNRVCCVCSNCDRSSRRNLSRPSAARCQSSLTTPSCQKLCSWTA